MKFKENESEDKLRGGYYTPPDVAQFLSRWIVASKPQSLLEPSCGDGAFIRALKGKHRHRIDLTAVEWLEGEAVKARNLANEQKLLDAEVLNEDFLEWSLNALDERREFSAVLGNPPYIRYQYLEPRDQKLAESIFARFQLPFTKHTNAWVPFIIASLALLAPGGRLAMVVPAELLHVLHADSLRKYLLAECSRILLIDPNELLFEAALQGTVLLMLEKKLATADVSQGVAIYAAPNNTFLQDDPERIFEQAHYVSGTVLSGKWMKLLLAPDELKVFEKVKDLPAIHTFKDIATVDVGIVTGANKFFLVTDATVKQYGLAKFARPMFGRSEHCPGIIYNDAMHEENRVRNLPTNFLEFGPVPFDDLPVATQEYIKLGEGENLHTRYKCRIRKPWYCVPSVYATELGMLKRAHNFPRLIFNSAGAYTTDTAYRIRAISVDKELMVYCFINSLTALTAELEGRHYGGGVLELVPSEIEKLLVPLPKDIAFDLEALNLKVKSGMPVDPLLVAQDEIILKAAGLSKAQRALIHQAWIRVRSRRHRLLGDPGDPDAA